LRAIADRPKDEIEHQLAQMSVQSRVCNSVPGFRVDHHLEGFPCAL
jgi:hypothetical protein